MSIIMVQNSVSRKILQAIYSTAQQLTTIVQFIPNLFSRITFLCGFTHSHNPKVLQDIIKSSISSLPRHFVCLPLTLCSVGFTLHTVVLFIHKSLLILFKCTICVSLCLLTNLTLLLLLM